LSAVPADVGWDEAVRLVRVMRADPSSAMAAALAGWDYPQTTEATVLKQLYDMTRIASGDKKWDGYPQPWPTPRETRSRGDAAGRTPEQVKELLRQAHAGLSEATV
jgi:hypothetical protein